MLRNEEHAKFEELAKDLMAWLKENDLVSDTRIYIPNGKTWEFENEDFKLLNENYRPSKVSKYLSDNTLCMTFEGGIFNVLNHYWEDCFDLEEEFEEIFYKHGFYYEMGEPWNLYTCK